MGMNIGEGISIGEILKQAHAVTGDQLEELVLYRQPEVETMPLQDDPDPGITLNRDPVRCTLEEILTAPQTPSFIAYSSRYIYLFVNYISSDPGRRCFFRIIPR